MCQARLLHSSKRFLPSDRYKDSRRGGRLSGGGQRPVSFWGRCGLPEDADSVAINVTAVEPTSNGSLSIYPADGPPNGTEIAAFRTGENRAQSVQAVLSIGSGSLTVASNQPANASVHFIIDVTGYYTPTKMHYASGSAFRSADGKIRLLIDETARGSGPAHGHFKRVLLGTSSDGINFDWKTFLRQSMLPTGERISISDVILVKAVNGNWWGFFRWGSCTTCNGKGEENNTGLWYQGRILVTMNAANPRGFVVYLRNEADAWQQVNDDGSFNFRPLQTGQPYQARSLVQNAGTWELWSFDWLGSASDPNECDDEIVNPPTGETLSRFVYQTVTPSGGYGAATGLERLAGMRPMPSLNSSGRNWPWRVQDMNGKRLLYSVSTDRNCNRLRDAGNTGKVDQFRGAEIVVTEIDN